jgi:hypothetical protein
MDPLCTPFKICYFIVHLLVLPLMVGRFLLHLGVGLESCFICLIAVILTLQATVRIEFMGITGQGRTNLDEGKGASSDE